MATFYSDQYNNAFIAEPSSKLEPKELQGMVRRIYATITLAAEIDTPDIVKLAKLPANAVIIEARLVAPGGTSGTLDLGWAAGANGLEVADANGILAALDGSAAIDASMGWSLPAHNKRFAEEVDIQLSATVITAGFNGDVLKLELRYIVD